MNKQVVSFISLFSLVLVLSIYYVMIPAQGATEKVNNEVSQPSSEITVTDAPSLFFTSLIENRKARHQSIKNEQIDILASDQYENEQKNEARKKLNQEELIETTEIGLENSLDELNFNEVFVELSNEKYEVTVYDGTIEDAQDITKVVKIAEFFSSYFKTHQAEGLDEYKPLVNYATF